MLLQDLTPGRAAADPSPRPAALGEGCRARGRFAAGGEVQEPIIIRQSSPIRVAASLALSLVLTACSSLSLDSLQRYTNIDAIARVVVTPDPQLVEATPTPVPPDFSTAALVKLRSKLRIGIRFDAPPLARVNDDGQLEGFDVELGREFAKRWLGSDKNVEFVQVTSSSAVDKVQAREIDMAMGGMTVSRAAESRVDFSMTYAQDGERC
jgi:ABC-type amino acid transport substrate-binding protein